MKTDKRLDVKLALTITDNDKQYHSSVVTWEDLPYECVLDLEKKLITVLAELNQMGYAMLDTPESLN